MTTEHWEQIRGLIQALDERLRLARLSASIRIVSVNGEPKLRVASERARGCSRLAQPHRGRDHRCGGTPWPLPRSAGTAQLKPSVWRSPMATDTSAEHVKLPTVLGILNIDVSTRRADQNPHRPGRCISAACPHYCQRVTRYKQLSAARSESIITASRSHLRAVARRSQTRTPANSARYIGGLKISARVQPDASALIFFCVWEIGIGEVPSYQLADKIGACSAPIAATTSTTSKF